jgi:hypothetical protein
MFTPGLRCGRLPVGGGNNFKPGAGGRDGRRVQSVLLAAAVVALLGRQQSLILWLKQKTHAA